MFSSLNKLTFCAILLLVVTSGIFSIPFFVLASDINQIRVFDSNGKLINFVNILPDYSGALDLAVGDFNGNGQKEIAVCLGAEAGHKLMVYDFSGKILFETTPFGSFKGGCLVTVGDLEGDNQDEIIVSADSSGGPHVKVYKFDREIMSFFVFDSNLRYGSRIWAGDLGNDGKAEIVAFSNYGDKPRIIVLENKGSPLTIREIGDLNSNGLSVAGGNFALNGQKQLAYVGGAGTDKRINFMDKEGKVIKTLDYDIINFSGTFSLKTTDINADGRDNLAIIEGFGGSGRISVFDYSGKRLLAFNPFDDFFYGVTAYFNDINGDGKPEIITAPRILRPKLRNKDYKSIEIDLSRQTLYQYQDGKIINYYKISSGKRITPTPRGDFKVTLKRPLVRMAWNYGNNHPWNYDLPNVPWVVSFKGPYALHGTYWHNNFGHPMSHGCVNMRTPEAKVIYDWSEIGTPVSVY
jgi:hypothetical protein